jgi:hypothetical protein
MTLFVRICARHNSKPQKKSWRDKSQICSRYAKHGNKSNASKARRQFRNWSNDRGVRSFSPNVKWDPSGEASAYLRFVGRGFNRDITLSSKPGLQPLKGRKASQR